MPIVWGVPNFRIFTVGFDTFHHDVKQLPYFFGYKTEFFPSKTIKKI